MRGHTQHNKGRQLGSRVAAHHDPVVWGPGTQWLVVVLLALHAPCGERRVTNDRRLVCVQHRTALALLSHDSKASS